VFNFLFTQATNNERRRWVLSPDRTHYQAGLPTREIKAKAPLSIKAPKAKANCLFQIKRKNVFLQKG
jgi:hypothetical protein